MKVLKGIVSIGLLGITPIVAYGAALSDINDIFQAVDFIKDITNFDNLTIESEVPYSAMQNVIQKYCPETSVDQAKQEAVKLNEVFSNYKNKPNADKSLSDQFDLIKGLISELKQEDTYKYCKDNYLLFSVLKTAQKLYNGEDISTNQNKSTSTQKSTTTVKQTRSTTTNSTTTTATHNVANDKSGTNNKIDFTFIHNTEGLPKEVRSLFSQNTDRYLLEIMADLVNIGILDQNDLKILNNKIKVTYQQSCEITEGAFHVMRNKQTGKYTFKEIELIIDYCDQNDTSARQKRHVQQILSHELGHYIYFFKDNNPSKFSEICWDNGKMNCLPQEFVSNYAKKSQEEDYAESFAYWYLYNTGNNNDSDDGHGSAPDNPINRRARYFEELFEKEEDEDDDEK